MLFIIVSISTHLVIKCITIKIKRNFNVQITDRIEFQNGKLSSIEAVSFHSNISDLYD